MEEFKIILPITAILISLISIYIGKKNTKRQLRIGKLEEILENVLYISNFYPTLRVLALDIKDIDQRKKNNENMDFHEKNFKEEYENFQKRIDKDKIFQAGSRITILTNAYLPNGLLKNKILTLNHLLGILYSGVLSESYYLMDRYYGEGIPHQKHLGKFLLSIENDLIKEMNLGFSSFDNKSIDKYRDKVFKKEMNIID